MSVMTLESRWRLLVGAAPLVGVAFFVWAAALGEADVASSPTARAILAAVAALGTAVAWWTARQLRVTTTLTVSQARVQALSGQGAGSVGLRGVARALPEAVPLVSPGGELCLWFRTGVYGAYHDSVRPFLLVDESGECIVLPAGAHVTGHGALAAEAVRPAPGEDRGRRPPGTPECLLRAGDRVRVSGRFVAVPVESLALQVQAAPEPTRHGLPLPVITASATGQPLVIRIGAEEEGRRVYGVLAVADCLVLLVSSSLAAWALLVAR